MNYSDDHASQATNYALNEHVVQLNEARYLASRKILFALGACFIVAIIFISSKTWIWTGGLVLAFSGLFRAVQTLRMVNSEIRQQEKVAGHSLKSALPTWITIGLVLAVPVAIMLGAQALNVYNPSIFAKVTNQPYLDNPATFDPSESDGASSGLKWYSGVQVVLPQSCDILTLNWHTENENSESLGNYTNTYSPVSQGLIMGESNQLIFGTNYDLSADEKYFVPDTVACD